MSAKFKSYKFRIYPNNSQLHDLDLYFKANREAYNYYLSLAMKQYKDSKKLVTYTEMVFKINDFINFYNYRNLGDTSSIKNTIKTIEKVMIKYDKGYIKEPKFNLSNYYSFTVNNFYQSIKFGKKIDIYPIKGIKFRGKPNITGDIVSVTILKTPTNKCYASFLCKNPSIKTFQKTGNNIGIDAGYMNLATLSDETIFENKNEYLKLIDRISYETNKLSKMEEGSKRFEKKRLKIAKLHEKIKNRRNDNLHKMTTSIVEKYDVISVEDLNISDLVKKSKYPNRIYDAAWYETQRMLKYKCAWYDKKFIKVDRMFPSSQMCSNCGYINKEIKDVRIKKWTCPKCNATHDRDVNAAINISNFKNNY